MSRSRVSVMVVAFAAAVCLALAANLLPDVVGSAAAAEGEQVAVTAAQVQPIKAEKVQLAKAKAKKSAKYKVKFKANGGEGKMSPQLFKFGQKKALKANRFKRAGYKFVGWNTKKDGTGKSYRNKKKVKNLIKSGKKAVLYAQWKMPLGNAVEIYSPVLESLKAKHYCFGYRYVDVMGDKTAELVAWSYPPNTGMYKHDYVYTIKSGEAKLVLDNEFAIVENNSVTYRKAAKSLVYHKSRQVGRSGSDFEDYYFKYKGGKFKMVARASRSWYSGEWSYQNAAGESISDYDFSRKTSKLTRGDDEVIVDISWGSMAKIWNEANRFAGL